MSRRTLIALGWSCLAVAFVVATSPGPAAGGAPAARPAASLGLYLPVALKGPFITLPTPDGRTPTEPVVAATATPTQTIAAPTSTTTPTLPAASVAFQIATVGGLTEDMSLGYGPTLTPWFTLYEDGTYIRVERLWDSTGVDSPRRVHWRGRLEAGDMAELLRMLSDEADFFGLPAEPPGMVCMTDGPHDYLYLSHGGQAHRVRVYGLSWFHEYGWSRCPWSPDPPDTRLVTLAEIVHDLDGLQSEPEEPYTVEQGSLMVSANDSTGTEPPQWPISSISLANVAAQGWYGTLHLEGDEARAVMQAIEDNGRHSPLLAHFKEDDVVYMTGFRVEFDGWYTYGPARPFD